MTALALRDDQEYWDENQLAVLRANGIEEGVTRPELQAYLHECQRRRLDPFTRQIYLIGRWDRQQKRKVYRSQTGIDGFRVIARRAADEAKESIEYEDTVWCGPDGQWTDVWLEDDPPAACKVVVLRDGKRFPATAKYSSYVQVNDQGAAVGLWRKMADNQLAKCTEALALRKAFPEDLGGLYTEEEMAQADNPQRVTATVEVIRDEPAGGDDPFYVRPAPENPWLAAALEAAPKHATLDACGTVWRKSAEMVRDGELTKADASKLQDLLRKRMEELKAAETADIAEVADLDADDPWADKVSDITRDSEADAVMAEAGELLDKGEIDTTRYERIGSAIEAQLARITQKAAA